MKYYRQESSGYITAIGHAETIPQNGVEISERTYNKTLRAIEARPSIAQGKTSRLKLNLTWEISEDTDTVLENLWVTLPEI